MMYSKKLLFVSFLLLCLLPVKAQFDVSFSNYWALTGFYNPASAGQDDRLNIYGTYSMQMMGFDNAPKSMYVGADMALKFLGKKHGVGAGFLNDAIGMFNNQRFWAQYAYKLDLFGGNLGIGVQLGALNLSFNPEGINFGGEDEGAVDTNDPAFSSATASGMGFDLGAGVFYTHPLFYAGFSAAHLTAPTVKLGENNEMKVDPTLYFTGGCNIKTKNPLISIRPSVMMMTDLVGFKATMTGRALYAHGENTFYGGLSYSPTISVGFLFGAKIKDFTVGYAYEMFTSKIGAFNGSHDLVVGYSMDMNFMSKSKNKHKSIRIL